MSNGTLTMDTCTFCAAGATNRNVTRESASMRGYCTPGKLSGLACAWNGGALSGFTGAGTNSGLLPEVFLAPAEQIATARMAVESKANARFTYCSLLRISGPGVCAYKLQAIETITPY